MSFILYHASNQQYNILTRNVIHQYLLDFEIQ